MNATSAAKWVATNDANNAQRVATAKRNAYNAIMSQILNAR
jgi:hypothetical protein